MAAAWMIRNNGEAIPVVQHIYANPEEPEETLAAAEWLYKICFKNRKTACKFIIEAYSTIPNDIKNSILFVFCFIPNVLPSIHIH